MKILNIFVLACLYLANFVYSDLVPGNTFDSMFFGAWVGGPETNPQPSYQNVAAFEALQGRHLDVIHHFVIWEAHDWNFARQYLNVSKQNGSIMLITWMPTPNTAQDILNGRSDNYINNFARGVKEFGDEIWLRPLHESNGDWYTWGTGKDAYRNSEDKLAAAYRHIVDIFRKQGVKNVKWIWTTNCSSTGSATFTGSYPGDDYVDYISIDGYNWGKAQSWSSWSSFDQVFSASYNAISRFNKPMFIAEFSSSELGGSKASWITEMFRILPQKFPRIVGLVWFSQSKPNNEGDWALNTSTSAVEAWKKGISAYPPAKRRTSQSAATTRTTTTRTTTIKANPTNNNNNCWSQRLGYRCCSNNNKNVVYTDNDGKWGVENGDWCGIIDNNNNNNNSCWSLSLGYQCCNGCNVEYTDNDGRWGVENCNWCGMINGRCGY